MPDGEAPSFSPANAGQDQTPPPPANGGLRHLLKRMMGPKAQSREELLSNGGALPADLSPAERDMIERILAFEKQRVDDVAIPRADIEAVDVEISLTELLKCFKETNHSRLPVYRGDLDDPIGMVHLKDVVGLIADPEAAQADAASGPVLRGIIRKILYAPPSMPVTDLLLRMQASRVHMALVIDEFGGTDGLVTIEDLVELIVGDMRDEHDDEDDFLIRALGEGRWDVDARMPLDVFAEHTGIDLSTEEHDVDTVGGLVFSIAGRVPLRGEVLVHPDGPEIDVVEADPRRVRRVKIRKAAPPPTETSSEAPEAIDAA